jgi:hypothetical protein
LKFEKVGVAMGGSAKREENKREKWIGLLLNFFLFVKLESVLNRQ